ncbi:hypothetical protein ACIBK8_02015 [Streptomyces sp. NPDC050161]|uniref:WXG100-like domain-containing protein n=1 Tax=Streptomyces sp. NPDC050161 TaxID=3365604 RepID=UPI00378D4202
MATIMLPVEVDWVLDLLGFQWPNVDEDKMRDAAEAWSSFAAAVRQYQQQGATAANAVQGANSGEAIEAFGDKWKKLSDGHLDDAADAAEVLAMVLQVAATIVMVMKIAVIVQLFALLVELAMAQAAAPVTLGASEAGAAAATATTRVVVRRIISEAKTKIIQAVREALEKKVVKSASELLKDLGKDIGKDMLKGAGQNVASQGIQSYFGAKEFRPDEVLKAGAKPLVAFDEKEGSWDVTGAGDKVKDVDKVGTGAFHAAEGVGRIMEGDFAAGGKQFAKGEQEWAEGVKNVYDIRHKDRAAPAEGEGDGTADGGSSGGGSGSNSPDSGSTSSDGGTQASSASEGGADGSGSSPATPASGTRNRLADGIPDNEAATADDNDEAARVRNAFG